MVVPNKASNRLTLDEAGVSVFVCLSLCAIVLLPLQSRGLPSFDKADPHEKYITRFESDVTLSGDFFDFLECDCMAAHTVNFNTLLLGIGDIVDKDSSRGNAILCPVPDANAVALPVSDLV